jgi:prepilin-type N-terminal cleavage/methylation domain-containing protein
MNIPQPCVPERSSRARRGFTLIELLVVIAIIALLIALALPALASARKAAQMTASLSNSRQITTAANTYRGDFNMFPPFWIRQQGSAVMTNDDIIKTDVGLFCPFSFMGKNCGPRWAGAAWDLPAAFRPLNSYIAPDLRRASDTLDTEKDRSLQIAVFKSPRDTYSIFGNPASNAGSTRILPLLTSSSSMYDDVGSSYILSPLLYREFISRSEWRPGIVARPGPGSVLNVSYSDPNNAFQVLQSVSRQMERRMNTTAVNQSKLVLSMDKTGVQFIANDDLGGVSINDRGEQTPPWSNWRSEFGDPNSSVMSYVDGGARYTVMERGNATALPAPWGIVSPTSNPAWNLRQRGAITSNYTMILP